MSIYVNHVEITEAEVGQEMQHHPAPSRDRAWQLAAQSLVIRQLLLQQAVNNGLYEDVESIPEDQEEDLIDTLLQQDVAVPDADEATCQRFYDNHPESFRDKESGMRQTFVEARAQIRDYLHTKAMRMAVAEYIRALSNSAEIKGFELANL